MARCSFVCFPKMRAALLMVFDYGIVTLGFHNYCIQHRKSLCTASFHTVEVA